MPPGGQKPRLPALNALYNFTCVCTGLYLCLIPDHTTGYSEYRNMFSAHNLYYKETLK